MVAERESEHQNSETYLRWVIDESGEFPDLPKFDQLTDDQVVSMGGGVDAATYLVKGPDRDVVVKLNSEGLEAEARALRAWTPYTERVPEVLGLGTVPSSENPPIRYLLLPALKNDDGEVVEIAKDYLERSPANARELGRAVGVELHRMHQAVCWPDSGRPTRATSQLSLWSPHSSCKPYSRLNIGKIV